MIRLLFLLCVIITLSCSSTQSPNDVLAPSQKEKSQHLAKLTLVDYLRNQPGVQIQGSGNHYKILIRGHKSIQGDNHPLYVLDGVPIGRSYNDAATTVDVTQIDRIRIVTPPRAGLYGSRGQNGVIEITTKKVIE